MSDTKKCQQQAVFRFTWPGRCEAYACVEHAAQLKIVADAMSFPLQLIGLTGDDFLTKSCSQNTKDGERK